MHVCVELWADSDDVRRFHGTESMDTWPPNVKYVVRGFINGLDRITHLHEVRMEFPSLGRKEDKLSMSCK